MKKNVLIIGAGGVAKVVAHKCAQHNDELGEIAIASRSVGKCQAIIDSVKAKGSLKVPAEIKAYALNALDIEATKTLIRETNSQIVINVGSAFLNMAVLRACMDTGAAYLDTAIHEEPGKICETPPWYGNYEWKHLAECQEKGVTAILGVGFDPGVVNAWAALAAKQHFDQIDSIDILDVNAGSHGKYFATNFDPEIKLPRVHRSGVELAEPSVDQQQHVRGQAYRRPSGGWPAEPVHDRPRRSALAVQAPRRAEHPFLDELR